MPSKRKAPNHKNNSLDLKKHEKHQAFLKDFDIEVDRREREMEKALNSLLITVDARHSRAIMKLPLSVRQMNYFDYLDLGGSAEAVARVEQKRINAICLEVEAIESEILKDATQLKTTRKRKLKTKPASETVNDGENRPPSSKVLRTTKHGVAASPKRRPPSTSTTKGRVKRTSRTKGQSSANTFDIWGPTPLITPKFNSRLPPTTARVRKMGERVFSFTGSPLIDATEAANGQNIQILASKISSTDINQLDDQSLKSIKLLSRQLNDVLKSRT
ncbi:borealin-like [Rhinoraja longicauda]